MNLNRPVTFKDLLLAIGFLVAGYVGAALWADHVALRALVVHLQDLAQTVNAVGVR